MVEGQGAVPESTIGLGMHTDAAHHRPCLPAAWTQTDRPTDRQRDTRTHCLLGRPCSEIC